MRDIYDIESYPNVFLFSAIREDESVEVTFEMSHRKNDTSDFFDYLSDLRRKKGEMVGFNNLGYDYPVIHSLWEVRQKALQCKKGTTIADKAYRTTRAIFASENRFEHIVYNPVVPQIDLYKIHHFDNKARSTGLKMLMFNMRRQNIQDLPYEPGTILTDEQIEHLIKYNKDNDVRATLDFYRHSLPLIEFREALSAKYGRSFMNHNDTKIGKDFFIMRLEEEMPGSCYNGRQVRQTHRDIIHIKDILFPYYTFKHPAFKAVLEWFKGKSITETKGVLTEIPEEELGEVARWAEMRVVRKKVPEGSEPSRALGFIDKVPLKAKKKGEVQYSHWDTWKVADNLNVVIDGFRFDFGTGGIHGSVENTIVESDEVFVVMDADVSSMYPNIAIANKVYPEHLSEAFCSIYKDVYEQRKSYAKGTPENAMLKLALNGVYGDSNNVYSPFYDPAYTMAITINGQLSLCLLAEQLMSIFGLTIIQVNTDGITVRLPRSQMKEYKMVCDAWQKQVGLELEFVEYSKMFIRDVNNYIAVQPKGVKRKGAYQYEGLGWHQDQGGLVIPKAAEAFMLYGTPVEEYVRAHEDIHDFMLRTKVPRGSKLMWNNVQQQNICRYYVAQNGHPLQKVMPPLASRQTSPLQGKEEERIMDICSGWNVQVCNNLREFQNDINHTFYIEEAEKLVIK